MSFDEIMDKLSKHKSYANANYIPIIRPISANFLYDFICENNIKEVLEIGTAIGFSGSIMMSAGVNRLVTIDINEDYQKIAKETFHDFCFDKNIEVICEDAKTVLPKLVSKKEKFDMVFLDGAKGQYINYLPDIIKLLKKDGLIFADNVLLQGMVESNEKIPHKKRTMVVNLRKYLERVQQNDFNTKIVRIEDGMAISKYKGGY